MKLATADTGVISDKISTVDDICCICLDHLNPENSLILKCHHFLCYKCIVSLPSQEFVSLDGMELGEEAPKCPLCRAPMPLPSEMMQYLYETACKFVQRARKLPRESPEISILCQNAQLQMQKHRALLSTMSAEISTLSLYFQILEVEICICLEKPLEAIEIANCILANDIEMTHQICMYIHVGECYIMLNDFEHAKDWFLKAYQNIDENDLRGRSIFHHLCRCFYELKDFDKAIACGENAVQMNRYYDGVYKYLVLSYKAVNRWDEAVLNMRKAVMYETPWDRANVDMLKQMLTDLLVERDNYAYGLPNVTATVNSETGEGSEEASADTVQKIL